MSTSSEKPTGFRPDDQDGSTTRPDTTQAGQQATKAKNSRKKRRGFSRFLGWLFGLLIGLPLLASLVLLAIAVIHRSSPTRHIPEDFSLYASLPSVSRFANEVIHLQALDTILTSPDTMMLRGLVRQLRVNPILRSKAFIRLANIRIDGALYEDNSFVAVVDLGWRSAITRLSPLVGRFILPRLTELDAISYHSNGDQSYYVFEQDDMVFYFATYRNLLIAASSYERFQTALAGGQRHSRELTEALKLPAGSSLRFLADPNRFTAAFTEGADIMATIIGSLDFPRLATVDLSLSDDSIGLRFNAASRSSNEHLAALLGKRSRAPAVLSRLPASTEYFSLLSLGSPEELWTNMSPFLDPEVARAKDSADRAARLAFGTDIDGLLFSWMGDELGLFGTSFGPAPVFFARVEDERQRKQVFDNLLGSLLVGRDVSAVVDGVRIPRIVFPNFLNNFLSLLGVTLIEPFYVVEDGILYASASAETLGACLQELRAGKLLVKSSHWEAISRSVSAESSTMVYYNLHRSLPFFLRADNSLVDTLKLYANGAFSLAMRDGQLKIELSAIRAESQAMVSIPGYPVKPGGRIEGDLLTGLSSAGTPMSYWSSGRSIQAMDLASGERFSLDMDDAGQVVAAWQNGRISRLWAVSRRGSIYQLDYKLTPLPGFPVLTGLAVSGQPAVQNQNLLVPVSDDNAILIMQPDGSRSFSTAMYARGRNQPAVQGNLFAVLPRGFDSWLYLFDNSGQLLSGWPVALASIASASPAIVPGDLANSKVAAVTEAGDFYLFNSDGSLMPNFPISLPGVFDATPLWVPGYNAFVLVCDKGVLWRVGRDAVIQDSVPLRNISGRNIRIRAIDINGDRREELFIGNDGNALMAVGPDLSPLPGYPLAGSGLAGFIDLDGNRQLDLIVKGADDSIHAYKLGK